MKKLTLYTLSLLTALVLNINAAIAQNSSYNLLSESTMTITGTSTIHDWEADVEKINLTADFADNLFDSEAVLSSADFINSLSIAVPVESIESGKGGMNNKIYDALKEKKNPNITYTFTKAELTSSDAGAGTFTLNATGQLTIAGATRTVNFPVQGTLSGSDTVQFQGSYELNMKDYNIDPPTAVFGTIKSGEKVTISFNILVANQAIANSQ